MTKAVKKCCACECTLKQDEIALSMKLLGRSIEEFYCLPCLAEYLDVNAGDLKIKVQELKEQGCSLFL